MSVSPGPRGSRLRGRLWPDCVQAEVGEEFGAFAVFDEPVGGAEALDLAGVEAGGVGGF